MSDPRVILVADTHPLAASAVSSAAALIDKAIVVEVLEPGIEGQDQLDRHAFHLLLLACDWPGADEIAASHRARTLLVDASPAQPTTIDAARGQGVQGLISGRVAIVQLAQAIATLLAGGTWFGEPAPAAVLHRAATPLERLSPAQRRVVGQLADGKSNREIADTLNLSEATIKSHLYAIYKALGVRSRMQAMLKLGSLPAL